MGVSHDGRLAEHIPHNQVGAFAAHTGQAQQRVKVAGHFAAVFIPQLAHTGRNIPRLAAPQSAGPHDLFNFLRLRGGQSGHIRVFGKQILYHNVHAGIGALCGKAHFHQQLPGVLVIQRTVRKRVFFFQPLNADGGQLFFIMNLHGGHTLFYHFPARGPAGLTA